MLTLRCNIAVGQALGYDAFPAYLPIFRRFDPEGDGMPLKVSMKVNGKSASAELEERTLLVTFIREHLRLTGTHVGCDTAQCGACTVLMNGKAIKSCSIVAMQAEGADILTIEGVAKPDGALHPMQAKTTRTTGVALFPCIGQPQRGKASYDSRAVDSASVTSGSTTARCVR